MLMKIWRKFSFGAFYLFIRWISSSIVTMALPKFSWVGNIIGFALAVMLSYRFRLNRGELRRDYIARIDEKNFVRSELGYMVRFDEFWIEVALAAVVYLIESTMLFWISSIFVDALVPGTAIPGMILLIATDTVLNLLFFTVADIAVWEFVHNKWREEHIPTAGEKSSEE